MQATFYTALLHHVGCAGYAHETAQLFGDELVANMAAARTDPASLRDLVATFLPTLTQGRPPVDRATHAHRTHEGRPMGQRVHHHVLRGGPGLRSTARCGPLEPRPPPQPWALTQLVAATMPACDHPMRHVVSTSKRERDVGPCVHVPGVFGTVR